ncbi:L10-interacting MYB domain-containing protein-like [Cynara cardunculus var. scolymus]|uniref:L10-interacting MYB domain-containing protein-like n=1 Tax=Cynara cardunculus var. scolymus TaxID=59895 RepID=UPI000D62E6EE|nr:L10-interacting MYB domain-containing protein-like [Cynara cardunculus var. scolymus]
MEKFDESSQPKRARVCWKDCNVVKTFLESCLREISINGREGGSLKAISWRKVAETLEKTHNFIVDQRQMKNHYDYLKGKYGAWSKLKNKTGNIYDASTNSFKLSEEEWQMETKSNKYVEKLRTVPLPFSDLCVQLFDGVASTGVGSWGPTSFVPNPTCIDPQTQEQQSSKTLSTRVAPQIQETQEQQSSTLPLVQESSSHSQSQRKKRKSVQPSSSVNDEEVSKIVTFVQNALEKQPMESEVGACIEKLEKFGWGSPLYEAALHLFSLGPDYKKIWLCLKDDKCEGWVRFTGRQLGFI